jgi:hypothetical protein
MDPKKPSGLEAFMDLFKEDALIDLIVRMLQDIHDCADEAKSDAYKLEMAFRRLLARIDKRASGMMWPSDFA